MQDVELNDKEVRPRAVFWHEKADEKKKKPKDSNYDDCFKEGTVVGIFLDQVRGMINFYKDGEDLGTAFISEGLKKKKLYPMIQIQQEFCELQIFHPSVFPKTMITEQLNKSKLQTVDSAEDSDKESDKDSK